MRPVLTHLALHVRDLDTSIAFYRDYCGMQVVHERVTDGRRVLWLAEPGREQEFIFVLVPGGQVRPQAATDYSHLGFALGHLLHHDAHHHVDGARRLQRHDEQDRPGRIVLRARGHAENHRERRERNAAAEWAGSIHG